MTLTFTLTCPVPSVNELYANNRKGGGRVKTERYRAFKNAAGWEVKAQKVKSLKGCFTLHIMAAHPKKARDIDNMIKPILDLCVDMGLVEDDRWPLCQGVSAQWSEALKEGVMVSIRPAAHQIKAEVA